jgi:type III restriction enzyme
VPEGVFAAFAGETVSQLQSVCAVHLSDLLKEEVRDQLMLPLGEPGPDQTDIAEFLSADQFLQLPPRYQKGVEQAVSLYRYLERKPEVSFAPVFTPLLGPLDDAAKGIMLRLLSEDMPENRDQQRVFFEPELVNQAASASDFRSRKAKELKKLLVDNNGVMPIGLLQFCLEYALRARDPAGGIFQCIKSRFADVATPDLLDMVERVYRFRNRYIAHQQHELSELASTTDALGEWTHTLYQLWVLNRG